jgi:PKD repeat protein
VADVLVNGTSVGAVTSYIFPPVTTNQTISATFAINTYTITASTGANGAVTPAGTTTVNYGATPTYTITPGTGYHVADVLVNGTSVGAVTSYTFPGVASDKTISATFAINQYTINATAGSNGVISPGNTTVNYGGYQLFTITPNTGYHVANVLVDSVSNGTITSYNFTNVAANHTIAATFAINTYNINATAGSNGAISPGNTTVNYGGYRLFTITPSTGYYVANVLVDSASQGAITSYNFTNVVANHTISATFGKIAPVAKFNATPVSGYAPLTVAFTDQSSLSITAWNWSFGDGNFSSVQNPTYIYQSPGNYSVSLNVTNASGSSTLTKNDSIWVTEMPFVNYVIENDVFVYGDQLSFSGASVTGPDATVILTYSLSTSDINGGTSIAVHTIYVNGDVTLNGGSAGLGSSTNPGNIYVTGDMSLLNGKRDIYGDVYILGNFNLKDARIHGNVYVDGDVTLMWTPTLDTNSHIYYTGTLTVPSGNYPTAITSKCIFQPTVPGFTMPSQAIPSVKSDAWYAARGYVPSGALADNLKIFANSYSSSSWSNTVSNVVIIAKTGDISITGLGGSGLRGVLFAPNGKVTFNGGFFEGVVIARDGFDVTSGGTTVTFTNLADYFSSSDDYPF